VCDILHALLCSFQIEADALSEALEETLDEEGDFLCLDVGGSKKSQAHLLPLQDGLQHATETLACSLVIFLGKLCLGFEEAVHERFGVLLDVCLHGRDQEREVFCQFLHVLNLLLVLVREIHALTVRDDGGQIFGDNDDQLGDALHQLGLVA